MSRVATNKEYIDRSYWPSPFGLLLGQTIIDFVGEAKIASRHSLRQLLTACHCRTDLVRESSSRSPPSSPMQDGRAALGDQVHRSATRIERADSAEHGLGDVDDSAHFLKIQKAQVGSAHRLTPSPCALFLALLVAVLLLLEGPTTHPRFTFCYRQTHSAFRPQSLYLEEERRREQRAADGEAQSETINNLFQSNQKEREVRTGTAQMRSAALLSPIGARAVRCSTEAHPSNPLQTLPLPPFPSACVDAFGRPPAAVATEEAVGRAEREIWAARRERAQSTGLVGPAYALDHFVL